MTSIERLQSHVDHMSGVRSELRRNLSEKKSRLQDVMILQKRIERARIILQEVARVTQTNLEKHVSGLCTSALVAVFPEPYALELEFVQRRGHTEADIYFMDPKGDHKLTPLMDSGGAADVAAFALRVCLWAMDRNLRPLLILDEPFRFLSADLIPRAGELLKELSVKLGLQIIVVTHSPALAGAADRVFEVEMKKGRSIVIQRGVK